MGGPRSDHPSDHPEHPSDHPEHPAKDASANASATAEAKAILVKVSEKYKKATCIKETINISVPAMMGGDDDETYCASVFRGCILGQFGDIEFDDIRAGV